VLKDNVEFGCMDAEELAHTHMEVHVVPHGFLSYRIRG
jgi:hypothetical protein